ncbi:MAG: hypothetical protein ABI844_12955 [Saprospiraceae bacterium]
MKNLIIEKFNLSKLSENNLRSLYGGKYEMTCPSDGYDTVTNDGCTHFVPTKKDPYEACDSDPCR